ncbi:MAG: carboxypeptidase regulatory-like domain-containing protein, partial [Prevotella sp.]|nr:carboxypeptidase regulatory-like domain-containing protein [Prevotella sp.]
EMEIVFDAPYTYNGGNLLIGVYNIATGNYKSVTWAGETVAGASVQGYNYSSLSGITASQRDFLPKTTFAYVSGSTPVPPVPTDPVAITPNPFDMGYRPINGWMEPMVMRIHNNLETSVTMTGNMSNTAGVNAFVMSEEVDEVVLESGEDFTAEIDINRNAAAGDYAEQFTLFYIENDRDITLVPVTATFYTAGEADIVETAKTLSLSYTGGVANFSHTPANIHPNYFGSQDNFANDAVYQFTLAQDALFSVTGGTFIGIYNKVVDFHPTAAVQPVAMTVTGSMTEQILVAGQYYMIVAGDNLTTVEGTVEQLPAPSELTAVSPADGATEVEAPVTLVWTGGENAAEYQVLFGTSPTNMDIALDWTVVDENYGSYTINSLDNNTQYFWQIKVRNSNGTAQTARYGFTTSLNTPYAVTATPEEIFIDESTLIKWKYSDGSMGDLPETQIGSGANTNSYLPTYNLYNYSLSEQIYTSEELGGTAGYINSISFHPVGDITRNLKVYIANTDKETFTGGSDWVAMTDENLVYEGNVAMVANTWVTIEFDEPFEYEGENIILAVTDHTGTWTSSISYSVFDATAQAINIYQDAAAYSATAPSGSGTVRDFKNQIIINKEDGKGLNANRDFLYYNVYYGDVKANDEPIYEKQYLLSNLPYNVEPGHNVTVTAVYEEGESVLSDPVVVKVSGYGTFTGTVTELISGATMAGINVKFVGKDEFNNNVAFEGTTDANGVYTINNVKAGNYIGTATFEGMEPSVSEPVTLAYQGTEIVDFQIHEVYKPVRSVVAEEMDSELARVRWSLDVDIPVPTPGT